MTKNEDSGNMLGDIELVRYCLLCYASENSMVCMEDGYERNKYTAEW